MKVVIQHLRRHGFLSVNYLDDLLLIGKTVIECRKNLKATEHLMSLGLMKRIATPPKIWKYLEFILNSNDYTIFLPVEKKIE